MSDETSLATMTIDQACHAKEAAPSFSDNEPVQHCDHCQEDVHNLSAHTKEQAERLVATVAPRCITYLQTDLGHPQFLRPASSAVRQAAGLAVLGIGVVSQTGCQGLKDTLPEVSSTKDDAKKTPRTMGRRASKPKRKSKQKSKARSASNQAGSVAFAEEPCVVLNEE